MPELEKDTTQETSADAQSATSAEADQNPQEQGGGLLTRALPSDELDLPPRRARYENRTARTLYRVHIAGLVLTFFYLLCQVLLTFQSYFNQKQQMQMLLDAGQQFQNAASLEVSLFYSLVGVALPLIMMAAVCFLFLFFAELTEQLSKKETRPL
ncbi:MULTISPECIES: hypothetical protein [Anaerotruncus]|jgi:hypothetical protein|uniref:Uncharacterized protein n=1 Tax=Anaerotruncus colihominis TaxID=169435 RepID=A0A845RF26_9FIRM|nr:MULTISPECIES: hypothetical protein [Anaerotruncus]MCI8493545.1 hypothetical protein [Anaerotruncus sp.]MCR2024968.1 hypothetical protein [Anaerotruncus colihominis]NBI77947.1 hypothetical protein [Anaerotruncus colihominis]NDO40187.1 hypothetical protein [Anaerotruncus colihominis]